MNDILRTYARSWLKEHLSKCTCQQQLLFKQMYSHSDLNSSIENIVDKMCDEKLNWAMQQVQRTLNI